MSPRLVASSLALVLLFTAGTVQAQDPVKVSPDRISRRLLLEAVRASGAARATIGPSSARSQDFLCGDDGLPG